MALNWGIEKVKDWEQISMAEKNGPEGWKTHRLIWYAMEVCLSSITEKNVDEWWRRLEPVQNENPPMDPRSVVTRDDLVRRIGLWTNATEMGPQKYAAELKRRAARR